METKTHLCFFKKGRVALWVCIWNQGGGGPKNLGTTALKKPGTLLYETADGSAEWPLSLCFNCSVEHLVELSNALRLYT